MSFRPTPERLSSALEAIRAGAQTNIDLGIAMGIHPSGAGRLTTALLRMGAIRAVKKVPDGHGGHSRRLVIADGTRIEYVAPKPKVVGPPEPMSSTLLFDTWWANSQARL
jgi:hypothetical protein